MLIFLTLEEQDIPRFDYIYGKYKSTVWANIRRRTYDEYLAEDIMQEVFTRFYKTMGKLQTEDNVRRWLFKITKNTIVDFSRKAKPYKNMNSIWLNDVDDDGDEIISNFLDKTAVEPLDEVLKKELAKKVSDAIETLKPIHANTIRFHYYFGFTVDEIAKMTKVPVQTVYSRLAKARKLLFDKLSSINDEYIEVIGGVFDEKE